MEHYYTLNCTIVKQNKMMVGNSKSNLDAKFIVKAVKSIIEIVQSTNKTNPDKTAVSDSIFDSIYNKVEDAMKKAGSTVENNEKDNLEADDDFFDVFNFDKNDDSKTEIDSIKSAFKIEEEKLKLSFQDQLNQLKLGFKERHQTLKQNFQSKIDALKEGEV